MRLFIFLVCIIVPLIASAQKKDTTYFNDEGFSTQDKSAAMFYRIYTEKDSVAIFSFTEYRKDGSYVLAQAKDNIEHPRYVGMVKLFDQQARLVEQHEYSFYGVLLKTSRYHTNGTLLQTITYKREADWPYERLVYEADSTGKANIVNGKGTHYETGQHSPLLDTVLDQYEMTGPYRNGLKQGKWTGTNTSNIRFTEFYYHGKLTAGKSTDARGKTYRYTEYYNQPDFGYQRDKVEADIKKQLINPADTLNLQSLFKRIYIDYTIDEHGTTTVLTGFKHDGTPVKLPLKKPYTGLTVALVRGVPVSYRVTSSSLYGYGKPIKYWVDVKL